MAKFVEKNTPGWFGMIQLIIEFNNKESSSDTILKVTLEDCLTPEVCGAFKVEIFTGRPFTEFHEYIKFNRKRAL